MSQAQALERLIWDYECALLARMVASLLPVSRAELRALGNKHGVGPQRVDDTLDRLSKPSGHAKVEALLEKVGDSYTCVNRKTALAWLRQHHAEMLSPALRRR